MQDTSPQQTNWAGNHVYAARAILHPGSVDELRQIVAAAEHVRALGSRHSFTAIADSETLVALDRLAPAIAVDHASRTVSLGGGVTYGALAQALAQEGVALANLASLPHISVAGAIATGTHGSGSANGSLATAVSALEIVGAGGELRTLRRGDEDFDGAVVALGALGIVVSLTLEVEPAYEVRQDVLEGMTLATLAEHFDEVMASGYSVSAFTRWQGTVDGLWVKRRLDRPGAERPLSLPGTTPARAQHHPIHGDDPASATPQLGTSGAWSARLPHFRMEFTPSHGDELQSEFLLARDRAPAAIAALDALGDRLGPLLLTGEIRTVAADALWLSPAHGRDTAAFHFTWRRRPAEVAAAVAEIEAALAPLAPRPHWGKVFSADAAALAPLYPRMADFRALVDRWDPGGVFSNPWLERHVLGRPAAPS